VDTGFWWEDLRKRHHLEHRSVNGKDKIKMDFKDAKWGNMDWINLAQDRERWRAFVNVTMRLRLP